MRVGRFILPGLAGLLLLGACSERIIATANATILIVAQDIDRSGPLPTADLRYLLATPTPVSGAPEDAGTLVTRMRYEAVFDCDRRAWGSRVQELTMTDGRVVATRTPEPVLQRPAPGSVGESALKAVCDPDFYKTRRSRMPLESIEKTYLARAGGR